jgi:hypothetical protein
MKYSVNYALLQQIKNDVTGRPSIWHRKMKNANITLTGKLVKIYHLVDLGEDPG